MPRSLKPDGRRSLATAPIVLQRKPTFMLASRTVDKRYLADARAAADQMTVDPRLARSFSELVFQRMPLELYGSRGLPVHRRPAGSGTPEATLSDPSRSLAPPGSRSSFDQFSQSV